MGKAVEVAPPPQVVEEERPPPVEDPPGPKTLISLQQLEQIDAAESAVERVQLLQNALGVHHYSVNPRTNVWVDFCFGVLNFGRDDEHLPPDKVLCLLTLAHEVYVFATQPLSSAADASIPEPEPISSNDGIEPTADATTAKVTIPDSIQAPADAYQSVEAVYDQFRDKIRHASGVVTGNDRPPDQPAAEPPSPTPVSPFSPTEVSHIVAFFTSTFFRHLRAYQYLSRVPRPSVMREYPLPTETPLPPPALVDAALQAE